MTQRVRICDIAEELGVSTATVSNVIHGKTKKISDETVKRVQKALEERQYIPSMAGILLAQNDSHIIGVIINDHEKYEGHVLEDAFISSSLNYLYREIEDAGYFLMLKTTTRVEEIVSFASMWNMVGLIVLGFCEQDYKELRDHIRIPFVVYDGYMQSPGRICNLRVDDRQGGVLVGEHFLEQGHQKVLCISDNDICMDHERFLGLCDIYHERAKLLQIPMQAGERHRFYREHWNLITSYTAIFAVSDYYAIDLMQPLLEAGIRVPEDIAIVGFDDSPMCRWTKPRLSSVRQDFAARAKLAVELLLKLKNKETEGETILLPVTLCKRKSSCPDLEN